MESESQSEPNLYEFDNYRHFLKAYYQWKKSQKRAFSFRFFSKAAGFRSPNFLKLVMEGKRNLTSESIGKFSKALKLNKEASEFFKNLVFLNQGKTLEEKQYHAKLLIRSRVFQKLQPLAKAKFQYWSKWYNVVIREMINLKSCQDDPEWIAQKLAPCITLKEAEQALKNLQELGFIAKNLSGRWVQTDVNVTTGDEIGSTSVAQFHRDMIQRGKESIDRFGSNQRQISSITFELSPEGAEKIRQMINQFRKDLIAVSNEDSNPKNIMQMNFQFFPLTNLPESEE